MTELDAIAHVPTVAQYDFAYQKMLSLLLRHITF